MNEIQKALKQTKKELKLARNDIPVTLVEHLKSGYDKWNFKRKQKVALKKTEKEMSKELTFYKNTKSLAQIREEVTERINNSVPEWVLELPLDRVSENCKQQIRELILVDIKELTDRDLEVKNQILARDREKFDKDFETQLKNTPVHESTTD